MPEAVWACVDMPKTHGGTPNSASRGQRGSGVEVAVGVSVAVGVGAEVAVGVSVGSVRR